MTKTRLNKQDNVNNLKKQKKTKKFENYKKGYKE